MQDFRPTILHHVLQLAPFDGWTDYTLREAVKQAGVSSAEAEHAFASIADCLRYYFAQVDETVLQRCPPAVLAQMRVPDRIEQLVMERLLVMHPHKEAVRRAVSKQLLPWNAGEAIGSVAALSDRMWRLAGDTATDYNYYTKRMTLMGVYLPTFWFWLGDDSADLAATRQFLKRRLAEVAAFGKTKKAILEKLKAFA